MREIELERVAEKVLWLDPPGDIIERDVESYLYRALDRQKGQSSAETEEGRREEEEDA